MGGLRILGIWHEEGSDPVDFLIGSSERTVPICDPDIISDSRGSRASTMARKVCNFSTRFLLARGLPCLDFLVSISKTFLGSEVVPFTVLITIGFGYGLFQKAEKSYQFKLVANDFCFNFLQRSVAFVFS